MGKFEKQTIFKSGVDLHFILWSLIFATATIGFSWAMVKLKMVHPQQKDSLQLGETEV